MSGLEKLLAGLAVVPFVLGAAVGPATPAPVDDEVVFSFGDPRIIESSGLVVEHGLFATVNDSGDSGRVFTVDPDDGRTVAVTSWAEQPEDDESMALLPGGDVLVGDIGDNAVARDSIELIRVPFGHRGRVDPTTYRLAYPDGPHDAETLLVHPRTGQVLVVAKEFIGRLYAAPRHLDPHGVNRLHQVGEVLPIATDGAFFPDGRHFVLRDYGRATFYAWPSLKEVGEVELPSQEQGEGIAVAADGSVYVSSEGQHSEVLRIDLPGKLRAQLTRRIPDAEGNGPPRGSHEGARDAAVGHATWWSWSLGGAIAAGAVLVVGTVVRVAARSRRSR